MDINEEKSAKSQLPIEGDEQIKATKSEEITKENDQVIIPPKTVTIESDKEENPAAENKNKEKIADEGTNQSTEVFTLQIKQSEEKTKCRPIAFLLGLPFALISLVIAFVGCIIWILGLILTCICPCCFCVTMLVEMALGLVNAPFAFFQYITDKIPF
ncbi:PREDICTED: uncharacterized protein LOC109212198 [Nicotiana attenuata]|uniref:Uncharacterized protein n=1 Tax=Nicotiana attenuata TaxID=49451 RepID=A0A314KJD7_NICAT|nr:PREDICTED: uncharacterized protein LOC109212198 [Nicotiana attenuata]OIT28799.1 hypothetical protein A4A49_17214 [Nicotiana attenuata]